MFFKKYNREFDNKFYDRHQFDNKIDRILINNEGLRIVYLYNFILV